ncbi:PrpR N-terminal domain-containing protein [Lacticaseibacillus baoqingensis]|uniref:PrpR N-terminal domain-containing protein n=1 Tax=Lacticaseibacillus baoqingensis TaxID=2486013 RepID=A0ABW4E7E9_9LACO|nr:sigma-54-dependent transcriptional regulator [Lacticaseibacillus baoqingensis]
MNSRVKILGIAPYSELATVMTEYGHTDERIQMTVVLGNMAAGVAIAKAEYQNYDVILSRGNTAELIKQAVPILVIDIGIGFYDVLSCIKLAENTQGRFAIIGYSSMTTIARNIRDLLQTTTQVYAIDDHSDQHAILTQIKDQGYQMVICDTILFSAAKAAGLTPILLVTSLESLKKAIDRAIYYFEINANIQAQHALLAEAIATDAAQFVVLDQASTVVYTSVDAKYDHQVTAVLKQHLQKLSTGHHEDFVLRVDHTYYQVHGWVLEHAKRHYYSFRLQQTDQPQQLDQHQIKILDRQQALDRIEKSDYPEALSYPAACHHADAEALSHEPLMIIGATGAFQNETAFLYYAKSNFNDHPLFMVDCALMTGADWDYLLDNIDSPFMDNHNTIYLARVEQLSLAQQKQLITMIDESELAQRNRLILSCARSQAQAQDLSELSDYLDCRLISLTPLDQQKEQLTSITNLLINRLNQQYAKQVVGLDADALALLQAFTFTGDYAQLKQILTAAVPQTTTPYITKAVLAPILASTQILQCAQQATPASTACQPGEIRLALDQPLNRSIDQIIQAATELNDYNQAATAKKLGISRTSVWRHLKA